MAAQVKRLRRAVAWCCVALLLVPLQGLAQTYPATLSNTAALTMPADTADADTNNNSSTDQNALLLQADVSVTKTVLSASPVPVGGAVRYQIVVSNAGPSRAQGITLNDTLPPQLQNASWVCTASSGSSCSAGSGNGNVALSLTIAPAGSVTVLINATAPSTTPVTIAANTANIVLPPTITDPVPGNNTATTTAIPVTAASIVAAADTIGPVNGRAGNATAGNVLNNDTLAGAPASTNTTVLSVQTPSTNPNITLNTSTGAISVEPATQAGAYSLVYQLCQTSDPNNCATATATVNVVAATLVANADTAGPVNGTTGGPAGINVLANDTLDGAATQTGSVTFTPSVPPGSPLTLNPDGSINVAANTPAGTYPASYTLCEVLNPSNCATATLSVSVVAGAAVIDAIDDSGSAPGTAGGVAVPNVLANDQVNGATATTTTVDLTLVSSTSANVTLNTTSGAVSVAAGTTVGNYGLTYRICVAGATDNCDTATVSITVAAAALAAVNDTAPAVLATTGGTGVVNVLTNDTFNGGAIPAGAVTLAPVNVAPITINTNGAVDVAANATPGTYTVNYTICEAVSASNCATAAVTVVVSAVVDAVNDAISTLAGNANAGNVLANDIQGGATPTASSVTLTQLSGATQVSIAADGTVSVAAGLAPQDYTARYRICQTGSTVNCDEADVIVTVNGPVIAVDAVNDSASITVGTTTAGNVLVNDVVGSEQATTANALVTQQGTSAVLTISSAGAITVAANAAPGTYTVNYQLCAQASPTYCDVATVSVTVNAAPLAIDAVADAFSLAAGANAGSVLSNDRLGAAAATPANVSVTQTGGQPAVTIAADGTLSVVAGTAPGNYTASYRICDLANAGNCASANVSVTVTAPAAVIIAGNDSFSTTPGGAAGNVLGNDTVDGVQASTTRVSVTQIAGTPAIVIGADGAVSAAAGTGPGTYSAGYRICDLNAPSNCAEATVTVTVTAVAAAIQAVQDSFTIAAGASGGNVLNNDTVGGAAATSATVALSQTTGAPVIVIGADGTVSVAAGTGAGSYSATYQICTLPGPGTCDTATVNVTVPAQTVVVSAVNDVFSATSGSAAAGNVLINDSIGGTGATATNAVVTKISGSAAIAIATDGSVSVAGGTASGSYTSTYQLCEAANTSNCATASVTVNVSAAVAVVAVDDLVNTNNASGIIGNVLANDSVDGATATDATVVLTQTTGAPSIIIASNGAISLAAGTTAGTYSATYRICQTGVADNCATASVTVNLAASALVIDSVNDGFVVVVGTTSAGNVLSNDTLDAAPATTATTTITQLSGGPVITIAGTGAVSITNIAAPGNYEATYQLCQTAVPGNCDTATVVVSVSAEVVAGNDSFSAVSGSTNAGNALLNDTVRGAAASSANVLLTQTSGQAALSIALDGTVSVLPGAPAGTATANYRICELSLPTSCATATVTVAVSASTKVLAVNDAFSTVAGNASVGNVLVNDSVDGGPVNAGAVLLTQPSGLPAIVIAANGVVSVPVGTAPGTYTATYQLCLTSAPTNCATATVSITVTAAPVVVSAVDDAVSSVAGTTSAGNVLDNDTVAGEPATTANVLLTQTGGAPAITISSSGVIGVAAGTLPGAYTATYQICQRIAFGSCASATVTVTVTGVAAVSAVDDAYSTTAGSTSVGNVLINDAVDGNPATTSNVLLSQLSGLPGVVIAPDGAVSIAAGTSAGTYVASYRICERANAGNCATANVTVTVNATVQPITAVADAFTTVAGNANAGNVLFNDSVGAAQASTANVQLLQTAGLPGIVIAADGTVSVPTGTAAGTYSASYQICQSAAPTSCATASVSVTVQATRAIDAVEDALNGTPGNASAGNVLGNDTLGGVRADPASVTLLQLSGLTDITIAPDGTVGIAAGASVGSHVASYQICEIAEPSNCDTASVTVQVSAAVVVVATGDTFSAATGSISAGNVLLNDTVAGAAATTTTAVLTQQSGAPEVLIAPDGNVSVAVGTPVGSYTASYRICALASPSSCATATVTVTVTAATTTVVAVGDAFSTVAGNANAGNVLLNDSVAGAQANAGNVVLVQLAGTPAVTIGADGTVSVLAGTAVGNYAATYRICALGAPTDCATASVTVAVTATAPTINAVSDSFSAASGSGSAGNVLLNDTVDGNQATTSSVLLTQTGGTPALLIATDGTVSIVAGTAPGSYSATYQICAVGNATACSSATVSVTVTAAAGVVVAVNDNIATTAGTVDAGNVLGNDTVDGAVATSTNVMLTQTGGAPEITIAGTGVVSVPANTPVGTYTATYQICQVGNAGNCASASVTVVVSATAPPIDAVGDVFVGAAGNGAVGNVLGNDTVNGAIATSVLVAVNQVSGAPAITISNAGVVSVASGTAAGSYVARYRICLSTAPTVCDEADVTVTVPVVVVAADDTFTSAAGNPTAGNVLTNDSVGGSAASATNSTVVQLGGSPAITISAQGVVSVASGLPAGTYSATYQLCATADPGNCQTATVSVSVGAAPTTVVAGNDTFSVIVGGPSPGSVLTNDTVGGNGATAANVDLTQTAGAPQLLIAADGTLTVASGTAPGTYTASYRICVTGSTTDCATASVSVTVTAASVVISASADNFSATPGSANAGNVLANDTAGGSTATSSTVVLTQSAGQPQILIATDGTVSVAAGTAPGSYTASYQICQTGVPGNCATATVSVTVSATAPAIVAVDDALSGTAGGTAAGNVLSNDRLGGVPVTSTSVNLTQSAGAPAISIAADGSVVIAAGTAAGTYTATYQICDAANTASCGSATVTVTVAAQVNVIDAVDDTLSGVSGGVTSGNVLTNDRLAGVAVSTANVSITQLTGAPAITIQADGTVRIAAGTVAGSYTASYRLCELASPTNCDIAQLSVTVSVATAVIDAVNDGFGPVNGSSGSPNLGNVLSNDALAGFVPTATTVILTQTAGLPTITIAADGSVGVPAGTAAGTYTATYRICETNNAANCDAAQVSVTVQAAGIIANDDTVGPVDGATGAQDVINVLANDQFNGQVPTASEITLQPVTQGPLSIDQNGLLDITPNTASGTYLITYRICDAANPSSCDDAVVTVTVAAAPLQAVDDVVEVAQNTGQVIAVLANDTQGGTALDANRATLSQVTTPAHGAAVSNGLGGIVYTPEAGYSGPDTFQYTVCEVASPSNCATATVNVTVLPNQVTAVDDTAQASAQSVVIEVLANDTSIGAPLDPGSLQVVGAPAHGVVVCSQGRCTYTPGTNAEGNANFEGTDAFSYRVCDTSTPTPVCATANVTVTVTSLAFSVRLRLAVAQRTVRIGGAVRYTATIENVGTLNHTNDTLQITPPPGFTYIEGTLRLDGNDLGATQVAAQSTGARSAIRAAAVGVNAITAAAESPNAQVVSGAPITVRNVNLDVGQSVVVTYYLRVGAGVGQGTHNSIGIVMENPEEGGYEISNWANAEVVIEGDPVQDESLVLGTVFDDRDGNGIQSPGERGIAGVRLGSVEGLVSTTDGYGRFHIIGIDAGNAARGHNFILKVDAATLPAGTTFTTPNPRVRRITAGIPVRFDFGVRLPQRASVAGAAASPRQIALAPALFDAAGVDARHAATVKEIADSLAKDGGQVVVHQDAAGPGVALQRALSAQRALQAQSSVPVDVVLRDASERTLLNIGGGAVQLSPAVFDGDAPRRDDLPLLQAVADGITAGGIVTVEVPSSDPSLAQRRVASVRAALSSRLPPGTEPRVRAPGAGQHATPVAAQGEGAP